MPKEKADRLKKLVESVGGSPEEVISDSDRAYLSFPYEDWEMVSPVIMSLL